MTCSVVINDKCTYILCVKYSYCFLIASNSKHDEGAGLRLRLKCVVSFVLSGRLLYDIIINF